MGQKFYFSTWLNLSEFTLLNIQVFNRRRPGELERKLIKDFEKYEGSLLIQKRIQSYLQILDNIIRLDNDNKTKIDSNSPSNFTLFAVPGVKNVKYLRACHIIRKQSVLCRAEHPERLSRTQVIKHIATTCIKVNSGKDSERSGQFLRT